MSVTITHVEVIKSTYNGKEKTSYKFTLSDGKIGYSANKSPWEFKEGETVDYTSETKQSAKGSYNLFTFARVGETAAPSKQPTEIRAASLAPISKAGTPTEMKHEFHMVLAKEIIRCVAASAIKRTEAKEWFVEMVSAANTSVDELFEA